MKKLTKSLKIISSGFTIIELMVTLAVVSIVLTVGFPSFQSLVQNGRLTSQVNQTIGLVSYARSEAVKRTNTTITMCGSSDTTNSTPTCNSNNWENGWLVMSDANGNRVLDVTNEDLNGDGILDPGEDINGNGVLDFATDVLLKVGVPLSGGNTLRISGFTNAGFVQFDSAGSAGFTGSFVLCDERGASEAKGLALSISGQSRLISDENNNSIVNDHAGVDVTCP